MCGYSGSRCWNCSTSWFRTTPSRISIARLMVSFPVHAVGPVITVSKKGSRASLISQLEDFQR